MRALFVELAAFERLRNDYLDDESFRAIQNALTDDPSAGDAIRGTGGLRKLRWTDKLYDKNELSDLSKKDRATLEGLLKFEIKMRRQI